MSASNQLLLTATLTLTAVALGGCALRLDDQHADAQTRMRAVAARMEADLAKGGMAALYEDVQACYEQATALNLIKRYALQDCIALDFAGYRRDVAVGRGVLKGPPLPYYEDKVYWARAAHYGHLAGLDTPQQLGPFLTASYVLVSQDMAQINTGPVIIDHPPSTGPAVRPGSL